MRRWQCPSCGAQHVSHHRGPHMPMHPCRAQKGLQVPFVEVPPDRLELPKFWTRHVPIEREDYEGDEVGVTHDGDGTAISAISTERADGSNDLHVLAPTAKARIG